MSAAVRFLVLAVAGWAVVRTSAFGLVPSAEAFALTRDDPIAPPALAATSFPPLDPVGGGASPMSADPFGAAYADHGGPRQDAMPSPAAWAHRQVQLSPSAVRVYYDPAPLSQARHASMPLQPRPYPYAPEPVDPPAFYAAIPSLDDWQLGHAGPLSLPSAGRSRPAPVAQGQAFPRRLDRLQLSSRALLRGKPGSSSLASGGTLGGSQAGARLTYAFDRRIALSLRTSSPVGGASGGEVAGGIRLTPVPSIPVSLTLERRQAIGRYGGRSDFALFAEGGLYQRPLPWNLALDAYGQAGIVGVSGRDLFADGSLVVSRPLFGRFSAGFGIWGGAQPGLYRVDAGPRLSMRVRPNVRLDLDWRQRIAGEAMPGSGPALTLAADF